MRWIALAALVALALSGCADDADDDGTGTSSPTPTTAPEPPREAVEFTAEGPFIGCLGDNYPCIGFQAGPDSASPDGAWFAINETLWERPFTATSDGATGDTDCWVTDADLDTIADPWNGAEACGGDMPVDAAWIFVYPYAEPATTITLTFPA